MKIRCLPCLLSGAAIGIVVLFGIYLYTSSVEPDKPNVIIDGSISMDELKLVSSEFEHNASIPARFTCDGENVNPPLLISGVEEDAKSLVLLMDDPDIPEVVKSSRGIQKFDHWVLFNIPTNLINVEEAYMGKGTLGKNSGGKSVYTGPCPPTEYKLTEHRYIFQLYTLDIALELVEGATMEEVKDAMKGHILQKAELIGLYDRTK